jgi:hypothetical protein
MTQNTVHVRNLLMIIATIVGRMLKEKPIDITRGGLD